MNIADYLIIFVFAVVSIAILLIIVFVVSLYLIDRYQKSHSILRNFPLLGRMRYYLENLGPELRQYLFDSDQEGRPFSRDDYQQIVHSAKYRRNVIGFGSKRDFSKAGYYIRNSLFPKQMEELAMDRKTKVKGKKYILLRETLFAQRQEKFEDYHSLAYLLDEKETIVIGPERKHPFRVRGLIGMSGMSFGALGSHAITALSEGLAIAKGTWMNTGEGGLSPYHLKGNVDIIMQIGPGLFGVRDENGDFDWDEFRRKSENKQVRAFELKLGQGAKIRGGHLDAEKVTPEIAKIRSIQPYQSVDSPNRFYQFHDLPSLLAFVGRLQEESGKPIGIKVVIGSFHEALALAKAIKESEVAPDFITVDGGEGGTGATFQELADSVGLPIYSALPILDLALRQEGVRDRVKLIASGKLFTADRIAVALAMGADLVQIARGFMISIGCIQALRCQSNSCPAGVATTDPELQKALVVDEKKYRVANYVVTLREGLFRIAAAAGLASPVHFRPEHVVFKDEKGLVYHFENLANELAEQGRKITV